MNNNFLIKLKNFKDKHKIIFYILLITILILTSIITYFTGFKAFESPNNSIVMLLLNIGCVFFIYTSLIIFIKNIIANKSKNLIYMLLILVSLTIVSNFILEFFQFSCNLNETLNWVTSNYKIFIFNTVLLFSLYMFIVSIIPNIYLSIFIGFLAFIIIGIINMIKLSTLMQPLYTIDFLQVKNIFTMAKFVKINFLIIIPIALLLIWLIVLILKKIPKKTIRLKYRALIMTVSSLFLICAFNFQYTIVDAYADRSGIDKTSFSDDTNYKNNGFIFGMISNDKAELVKKPENYSKENIDKIIEKYSKNPNENNENIKPNIIYIMSESFWNGDTFNGFTLSEDPLKNINSLKTSKGNSLSPSFGGQTANVEFEALTSFSMYNMKYGGMPYEQYLNENSSPSIVSFLKEKGYYNLAIHPFEKEFYERDKVYPNLGFDEFHGQDDMYYTARLSEKGNISDDSLFKEIEKDLRNNDSPMFIHAVTMQNHSTYFPGKNGENSINISSNEFLNEEDKTLYESYVQGTKETDIALNDFLNKLKNLNEPTIIVFWGDHLPNFLNNDSFKESNFLNNMSQENKNLYLSQTPLIFWSNYKDVNVDLNSTSPIFYTNMICDIAGLNKSPFYEMMSNIHNSFNGIKDGTIVLSDGNIISNPSTLSDANKSLLNEYNLIEYDILEGNKYSLEKFFK